MIEEPQFLAGSDLVLLARPHDIDSANSLYECFHANINVNSFYCMEVWFASYWRSKKLNVYPINFRHGPDFDVIKSREDLPVQHLQKNKDSKYYSRLVRKWIYSILPYCLVKTPIQRMKAKTEANEL